jgi:general secretion pathway protein F
MIYIVPRITSIFADMEQVLPTPTRILIFLSDFFKSYWWMMIALMVVIAVIFNRAKKNRKGTLLD